MRCTAENTFCIEFALERKKQGGGKGQWVAHCCFRLAPVHVPLGPLRALGVGWVWHLRRYSCKLLSEKEQGFLSCVPFAHSNEYLFYWKLLKLWLQTVPPPKLNYPSSTSEQLCNPGSQFRLAEGPKGRLRGRALLQRRWSWSCCSCSDCQRLPSTCERVRDNRLLHKWASRCPQ